MRLWSFERCEAPGAGPVVVPALSCYAAILHLREREPGTRWRNAKVLIHDRNGNAIGWESVPPPSI